MNGLHSCKPGNEPVVGQVKTFTVEQRTGKSGKAYTKIKSAPADQGGQPYRITAAKPTGHTDSYGNISFNLDIEPENGGSSAPAPQRSAAPARGNGNGDEVGNRIERQHSQEMAIRYCNLRGQKEISTAGLRELIDWFQRDVGHVPNGNGKPAQAPPPADDGPPDEEPF